MRIGPVVAAAGLVLSAQGALYEFSGTPFQTIPDNNPSGVAYSFNFAETGLQVTDVSVSFTLSGGYNGDQYAYLSHGSSLLVLVNRVGVANGTSGSQLYNYGYSGSGFSNITLSDAGAGNLHNYGGSTLNSLPAAGGTYKADGQTASPLMAPTGFSAGGGTATFASTFVGTDPNGSWTLFFADASGGSTGTLDSWSVDITAVPEPVNLALGLFVLLLAGTSSFRFCRRRRSR